MKAAVVMKAGLAPAYGDFAKPLPGLGETLIEVSASALNPLARDRAAGTHYSSGNQFPFVAGVDGIGQLDDGTRVYFMLPRSPFGSMAEWTVVPDGQWLPLPDGLDDVAAATIANPGMSSWAALTERAKLRAGETVLVNGATGASGQLAVLIARNLGAARVIASGRNFGILASLGADATIVIDDDNITLEDAFKEQFAQGVDVVLDYLWGPSARCLLIDAAKASRGGLPIRFVQIGSASGAEISMPAAVLRSSPIEIKGSGLGSIGLDRLLAAVGAVFSAASEAGLALEYRAVSLASVASTWADDHSGGRLVYVIGKL